MFASGFLTKDNVTLDITEILPVLQAYNHQSVNSGIFKVRLFGLTPASCGGASPVTILWVDCDTPKCAASCSCVYLPAW